MRNMLKVGEIANLLTLSKRAVFRMNTLGSMPQSVTVGKGAIRWRESDIDLWIDMDCPDRPDFDRLKAAKGIK